ncbi:hypothetical protein L3C95_14500 [Chitinophaga filiformis]|uniref:hypothetical protein n=1 Tax=Chitinophaga filiformis TaxID=104663 RepID=UPI001F37E711|nr:hypothetical protein [Chitinophaga filiformis]MCF6404101.1 hypothetical protein [Chitinophaga filiformis]
MHETVSVDEAISKGHRMVNYPVMTIMLGMVILSLYLGCWGGMPVWIIPVGLVLSFTFAWLYWSFMITKWRIWAFENVRNVHELKRRAIMENLIWQDNSIFEKTEIRKAVHKEKWQALQSKFEREDVFHDDLTIPTQTIIYYSKGKKYLETITVLICLPLAIFLMLKADQYIIVAIFTVVGGAYWGYREYKGVIKKTPQIIISNKGIQTVSTMFYEWKDIKHEEIVIEGYGEHARCYLKYDHPGGSEHLQIDHFDTDKAALDKLLTIYRGRSGRKTR